MNILGTISLISSLLDMIFGMMLFHICGANAFSMLIPLYGSFVYYKLFWKWKWFIPDTVLWLCILLLPIVFGIPSALPQLVLTLYRILLFINVARCFGKSTGFGVGLWALSFVFFPILLFGKSEYTAPENTEKAIEQ